MQRIDRHPRRAFTLMELLVVIAIIVLLVSVLLPALSRARVRGQAVNCAANLKALTSTEAMYAADFEGWIPFSNSSNNTTGGWEYFLINSFGKYSSASGYAGAPAAKQNVVYDLGFNMLSGKFISTNAAVPGAFTAKVLICPQAFPYQLNEKNPNWCYGINLDALPKQHTGMVPPAHNYFDSPGITSMPQTKFVPGRTEYADPILNDASYNSGGSYQFQFAQFSQAQQPSTGVMFGDSVCPNYANKQQTDSFQISTFNQGGKTGANTTCIHLRHGNTGNLAYWDGHVENCTQSEVNNQGIKAYCTESGLLLP